MTETPRAWWPIPGPLQGAEDAIRRGAARALAAKHPIIDPLSGDPFALAGRVVTMDSKTHVHDDAVVYIRAGTIVAITGRGAAPPAGFESIAVLETGATLYPGLIELHNHVSYNILPIWSPVPRRFEHRDQWSAHKDYRKLISGPMTVFGKTPSLLPALVRYVEAKCLLGGVTTTQGIKLNSNAGISRYYRGLVRNVEQTYDPDLPAADARILDVEAKDASAFEARLEREKDKRCCLLHLSEGVTAPSKPRSIARKHFLALEVRPERWAITNALAGIHATGLLAKDFDQLARRDASIVWSPFSNLLLYGETSRVDAARAEGVQIGIGSDWSPTGSRNLLGELKVAWLYSQHFLKKPFSAREIVAMATSTAARILRWDKVLGSLEPGKRADIVAVEGTTGDPYEALIRSNEKSIHLVMINGVARYGIRPLMAALAPSDQTIRIGGESRRLFFRQSTSDPDVQSVSLAAARDDLEDALKNVRRHAERLEARPKARALSARKAVDGPEPLTWSLALDEVCETGVTLRPRLPYAGPRDFTGPKRFGPSALAATIPLSQLLDPIRLDPLTVLDDAGYFDGLERQPNLPQGLAKSLKTYY